MTDYRGDLRGFQRMEELIPEVSKGFGFGSFLVANVRVIALSISAILLTGTICCLATQQVSGEVLIGFAGSVIGYIAGKVESKGE